jgi:flagellar FliJ protein
MAKSTSSLETLLELTQKAVDEASIELAQINQQLTEAENQWQTLSEYRQQYMEEHIGQLTSGIHLEQLSNFKLFVTNLDKTMQGQQQVVDRCRLMAEEQRLAWQACKRKQMSFEVLLEKEMQKRNVAELKREQKATDEFVNARAAVQSIKKRTQP